MCFSCQWCFPLRCLCGLLITQDVSPNHLGDLPRPPGKVWVFVFTQNSVVEILTSKVEAFGRCLGHEGGTFMNGISTFIKESPPHQSAFYPLLPSVRKSKKAFTVSQKDGRHPIMLAWNRMILDFQPPKLWDRLLRFISHPAYGIF